jgi:hypothetical protein
MSLRSLFTIILKVIGIFFIKDLLATLQFSVTIILYITNKEFGIEDLWTLISTIVTLIFYCFLSWLFIFKSEFLVEKLKLAKGFDQDTVPLNVNQSTILSISIFVTGGLMLVNEIPNLFSLLIDYFLENSRKPHSNDTTLSYSALSGIKILVGVLLIIKQRHIVNYIEYKRRK